MNAIILAQIAIDCAVNTKNCIRKKKEEEEAEEENERRKTKLEPCIEILSVPDVVITNCSHFKAGDARLVHCQKQSSLWTKNQSMATTNAII